MKWVMRFVWFYALAVLAAGFVALMYVRGESRNWSPGFFIGTVGLLAASGYGVWRGQRRKGAEDRASSPE